jgi:hypothetical protein
MIQSHEIDEETLKKLPYWKQWLYKAVKEVIEEKRNLVNAILLLIFQL